MQDKVKGWIFFLGFLFIIGEVGISDNSTPPADFWWAVLLVTIGMALMFFSFEMHRNPSWLKRKYRQLKFKITGRL